MPKMIEALCEGQNLSRESAQAVFASVMRGELSDIQLAALLIALKSKGETPSEIAGAAQAMRAASHPLDTGGMDVADSCGTGGDGAQTVNISTAAAIVSAAGGVKVAKHGNRSISSRCGSADLLEACGIPLEPPSSIALRCLEQAGICFLYAPQYHPGVRHAMKVRKGLGVRTIFNLLGPLSNPATPRYQLMGVYDPARCPALAETLGQLGCQRALVVHGGGLDEIALHAATHASLLEGGEVRNYTIKPESLGVQEASLDALRGGDPEDNAQWLHQLLGGQGSRAHRDAVALNAGALLWLSEKADSHRSGVEIAQTILDEGKGLVTLDTWSKLAQSAAAGEDD